MDPEALCDLCNCIDLPDGIGYYALDGNLVVTPAEDGSGGWMFWLGTRSPVGPNKERLLMGVNVSPGANPEDVVSLVELAANILDLACKGNLMDARLQTHYVH